MLARVILLLGVTALSLCCVEAQRKLAQSAAAPAPAGPTLVQDLLDVLGRNQSIGNTVTDASAIDHQLDRAGILLFRSSALQNGRGCCVHKSGICKRYQYCAIG